MTDDSVNYDDDNDDGDNEDDVQEDNNDSNEDEVIVIDSDNDEGDTEFEISAINLTLQRTTKLVAGAPVSVKRSMSLGYTENVNMTGVVPRKLFEII